MRFVRRSIVALVAVGIAAYGLTVALAGGATVGETVTVGSTSGMPTQNLCGSSVDCTYVPFTGSLSSPDLEVPFDGTVTAFSVNAGSAGGTVELRVLQPDGGGQFTAAGTSSPETLSTGVNTFSVSVPVKNGDVLGLENSTSALMFDTSEKDPIAAYYDPSLTDGSTAAPNSEQSGYRLLLSATVQQTGTPVSPGAGVGVYTANNGSDNVSAFSIDVGGALTPAACATGCTAGVEPYDVAVNPSGRYVYVTNEDTNSVSVFLIGAGGALTPVTCTTGCATGDEPYGVAVDPSGRYVYVANEGAESVSVFSIGAGGALTPVACTDCTTGTGSGPEGVAVDPSGPYVYVIDNGSNAVSVFSIGAGGSLTPVTCTTGCETGSAPAEVAVDPSGRYLYVSNIVSDTVSVFSIGAGGALTPVTCTTGCETGNDPFGVAIDPSGRYVYVTNASSNTVSVFSIGADGALTPITCTGCGTGDDSGPQAVAVDPSGSYVYVTNEDTDNVSVFSIGADGALTPVGCTGCGTGTGSGPQGVAVAADQGPTATFSTIPGPSGTASAFDASGSDSPAYPIAAYAWNFGDGQTKTSSSPTITHVFTRPGKYTVTLTVTDQAGCSTTIVYTGQTASCDGSSKATSTQTVTVASPAISALSVSPRKLSLAGRRVDGKCRTPTANNHNRRPCTLPVRLGVRYTLTAPDTVTVTLTLGSVGREVAGRCVDRTATNDKHKSCNRRVVVHGKLTVAGKEGANRLTLDGRLGGHDLGPGTYQLTVTPAAGRARQVTFRILA